MDLKVLESNSACCRGQDDVLARLRWVADSGLDRRIVRADRVAGDSYRVAHRNQAVQAVQDIPAVLVHGWAWKAYQDRVAYKKELLVAYETHYSYAAGLPEEAYVDQGVLVVQAAYDPEVQAAYEPGVRAAYDLGVPAGNDLVAQEAYFHEMSAVNALAVQLLVAVPENPMDNVLVALEADAPVVLVAYCLGVPVATRCSAVVDPPRCSVVAEKRRRRHFRTLEPLAAAAMWNCLEAL